MSQDLLDAESGNMCLVQRNQSGVQEKEIMFPALMQQQLAFVGFIWT
jgi:hypothetical protein